jgi:hypothetical protein
LGIAGRFGVEQQIAGAGDAMTARNLRRLLSQADSEGHMTCRQAQKLVEAKMMASHVILELATIESPPAVIGTALAIVVGTVAAQVCAEAREDFYGKFLSAARACEKATAGRPQGAPRH